MNGPAYVAIDGNVQSVDGFYRQRGATPLSAHLIAEGGVLVAGVGRTETVVHDLAIMNGNVTVQRSWVVGPGFGGSLVGRPAWGSVDEGNELDLFVMQDGILFRSAVSGSPDSEPVDVWQGSASGAQPVLLANINGRSGVEVLSYSPASSQVRVQPVDGSSAVNGWPLDFQNIQTGSRQVLVADLDGPLPGETLRDLEVVMMGDTRLEVHVLGPGSYEPEGMAWPVEGWSASSWGVRSSGRDPLRPGE